jgi:hypothetical protein
MLYTGFAVFKMQTGSRKKKIQQFSARTKRRGKEHQTSKGKPADIPEI